MSLRIQAGTFFQRQEVKRVQYFLLLVLFWLWVSLGLAVELKSNSAFLALKPALQTKVFLVALLFGGRYLFFPGERWRPFFRWAWGAILVIICGVFLLHDLKWLNFSLRAFFQLSDMAVWALVLAALLELVAALFRKWRRFNLNPPDFMSQWTDLRRDLKKLAFFTLFALTILYYYLVNLFLVDTFYYSYLAILLFGACGAVLYGIWYGKVVRWAEVEISQLDESALSLFKTDESGVRDILPWYQYLVLTRNYLEKIKRPQMLLRCLVWYLIGCAWLLAMPFVIGLAVPV